MVAGGSTAIVNILPLWLVNVNIPRPWLVASQRITWRHLATLIPTPLLSTEDVFHSNCATLQQLLGALLSYQSCKTLYVLEILIFIFPCFSLWFGPLKRITGFYFLEIGRPSTWGVTISLRQSLVDLESKQPNPIRSLHSTYLLSSTYTISKLSEPNWTKGSSELARVRGYPNYGYGGRVGIPTSRLDI